MEEGFILMNLSKHKMWTAHRVIPKQQEKKRTDSSCVFTHSRKVWKGGER